MRALMIGSTEGISGKTMVTIGLATALRASGYSVGYMKPLGRQLTAVGGGAVDADAQFLQAVLGLPDDVADLCPVMMTPDLFLRGVRGEAGDIRGRIRAAFDRLAAGKDVLLLGGTGTLADGAFLGVSAPQLSAELGAPILLVEPYRSEACVDRVLLAQALLGNALFGVVFNRIPPQSLPEVEGAAIPFLAAKGVEVLGAIPQDRHLDAITVRQLVEVLDGKVVCGTERLDAFVERFSVGAMDADAALGYFQRVANKAVITGGHRTDIQLAALETSTTCLVLTGDQMPNQIIAARARDAGVPIVCVAFDTLTTVEKLQAVMGKIRIREASKVRRTQDLLHDRLNSRRIIQKLGLKSPAAA
ncbi:MAG: phosphotransacetylase family protein [Candidatus Methylomirabilota bacterium]